MSVHASKPVWDEVSIPRFDSLKGSIQIDVVIIGGGITGLSAAWFLKQSGLKVCVLEREALGRRDTGHTTAHLTCVTDARLGDLVKAFGREQAALVWSAGVTALNLIEQTVTENQIDCEFRRVPGCLHAAIGRTTDESEELRREVDLAQELGFEAEFLQRVPIVEKPGMLLRDQGKFHPRKYLAALAQMVDGGGCGIYEDSEVTEVESDPLVVVTREARIACDYLVIATHVPLLGARGLLGATLLQSKLAPYSSYVVSGRSLSRPTWDVSLWDTSDPYYYLRIDSGEPFNRVIFGGNDHKTGQESDTDECYRRLEQILHDILPEVEIDHRWSGQVIKTSDGLPFIGESAERQFVATGFNGNGFTFATLAGLMARDAVLGTQNPWQQLFALDRKPLRGGAWDYLKENLDYPYYTVADRVKGPSRKAPGDLKRGEGAIIKRDGRRVACSRDQDGQLHQVSAVCTHMGCLVRWNGAEQSWDCPCHGSRFRMTGEVMAGPAESPLEEVVESLPSTNG